MKLFIIVGVVLLLSLVGVSMLNNIDSKDIKLEEIQYQGPVPIGYNLGHFRNTGETIVEVFE